MVFTHPIALLLLPVVPSLLVISLRIRRKRTLGLAAYLDGGREAQFWPRPGLPPPLPSRWRRRTVLMIASGGALVLAMAGPGIGTREAGPRYPATYGSTPVVLMVDVSRSMNVEDVAWGRLGAARLLAHRLAASLPATPMALTVFADQTHSLLPPSMDRDLLFTYLDALDPAMVEPQGTALAAALGRVAEEAASEGRAEADRSGESPGEGKGPLVVLFTDGESPDGDEEVLTQAARVRKAGGTLAAIVSGTASGGPVPASRLEPSVFSTRGAAAQEETPAFSKARPTLVRRVAEAGGGRFASAQDPEQVAELLTWMRARLEGGAAEAATGRAEETPRKAGERNRGADGTTPAEGGANREPVDRWEWFAGLALGALLLESALSGPFRREVRAPLLLEKRAFPGSGAEASIPPGAAPGSVPEELS